MERTSSSENTFMRPRGSATKNPAVSALQDLLFYQIMGIGFFAYAISEYKKYDTEINNKISRLIYLTNKGINFDILTMMESIQEAYVLKNKIENTCKILYKSNNKKHSKFPPACKIQPGETLSQMVSQANVINIQKSINIVNFKVFALKELIRESLTSTVNYIEHIKNLTKIPMNIYKQIYDILNFLCIENAKESECKKYALKAGELQTEILELLFHSYEKLYGIIQRKNVSTSFKKGYAILVAGEDFEFLINLLKETQDKDINIYTYGGLNYAHAFPEINKYSHLVGIYKSQYNNFAADIESFPGVVVLTSGNIEELTDIYRGRVFSTENISLLGISKIDKNNLKPLINSAYDADGFEFNEENTPLKIGFGMREIEKYSEKFANLIKGEKIKNLNIVLGCNEFFNKNQKIIKNKKQNVVFTIDCNTLTTNLQNKHHAFVLDLGQFVNLYNLVRLVFNLSGKLKKDINELPLKIIVNLHNSETVAGLLMLLSLGFKNIKINSDLPLYLTDNLINTFQKEFNLNYLFEESDINWKKTNKMA